MPKRALVARFGRSRTRGSGRTAVGSTCLRSVGYDEDLRDLDLEFRDSGAVYRYYEVAPGTHTRLIDAASKGRFFNRNIRNTYAYSRLSGGAKLRRRRPG